MIAWRLRNPGVEIRLTWGWLALMIALAGIAIYELSPVSATLSERIEWGLAAAVLIVGGLASLAIHEAAHLLVSIRQGRIIPWLAPALVGTLPDSVYEPEDPHDDALLAAAGPLATSLVTIILGLAWFAIEGTISLSTSSLLGILTLVNGGLLLMSLMPGYPFDGSRMLRAFIWYITDDLILATRIVTYYGHVLALMGIGGGAILIAMGDIRSVWGAFLVVTFWAINRGISQGMNHIFWSETGKRLRVDDVFQGGGRRISADTTIDQGVDQLLESHRGASTIVVDSDQKVIGLIALRDLRSVPREEWHVRTMRDVMHHADDLASVSTTAQLSELIAVLPPESTNEVLLARDGRVIGAVNRRQLVHAIREYLSAEHLENLRRQRR